MFSTIHGNPLILSLCLAEHSARGHYIITALSHITISRRRESSRKQYFLHKSSKGDILKQNYFLNNENEKIESLFYGVGCGKSSLYGLRFL